MAEPSAAKGMRDQEVLARTLYAEARAGGVQGMTDVAHVILNRAACFSMQRGQVTASPKYQLHPLPRSPGLAPQRARSHPPLSSWTAW